MRWHTGLDNPSAEEIHQLGLDQIEELRPKVMALAAKLGYEGQANTMRELFDKVEAEEGQFFKVS